MKGLVADPAVKEAADAYTMQASLCFFYSIFIQFHTVGVAVVTCGDLPQCFSASTARIKDIGGNACRKLNAVQNMGDVFRICGVIAHANLVHQSADDRSIDRI